MMGKQPKRREATPKMRREFERLLRSLAKKQERLGPKFEHVLEKNRFDLYSR